MQMKKQIVSAICLLMLTACSDVSSPTLCDMFGWCRSKYNVKYVDAVTMEEVSEDEALGYSLMKRGDRYDNAEYVISPQVYGIVATRATNKMLSETPAIFAPNKDASLFVADTVLIDRYLPDVPNSAGKTTKDILYGSKMFNIVDDKAKADYVLESSLNNVNTPEIPVIAYELRLLDNKGNLVGNWFDTIRQVQNDDGSWW